MKITMTGEMLYMDEDDFCKEFTVELDDESLEDNFIQIEAVEDEDGKDVLHRIDQEYAKKWAREILDCMKEKAILDAECMEKGIDL